MPIKAPLPKVKAWSYSRWNSHSGPDGCPQRFPNVSDIFGDGALGAHGGSGLSGFGGSVRAGELLPATGPIRHALKLGKTHRRPVVLTD